MSNRELIRKRRARYKLSKAQRRQEYQERRYAQAVLAGCEFKHVSHWTGNWCIRWPDGKTSMDGYHSSLERAVTHALKVLDGTEQRLVAVSFMGRRVAAVTVPQ